MAKFRRNGLIFVTWIGDHAPRHVHVYSDSKLIVKWDLDNNKVMKGTMNSKIKAEIEQLVAEGKL